jgi:hypothetical protein
VGEVFRYSVYAVVLQEFQLVDASSVQRGHLYFPDQALFIIKVG